MAKYKVSCPKTAFCVTQEEAEKTAESFGYPVFLKIYGKNILHRTEENGVGEATDKGGLEKMFLEMM